MEFEVENLQWLIEEYAQKFKEHWLLVDVEQQFGEKNPGYDLVIYDVTGMEYAFVNATELKMYCFEEDLDEAQFEIERVTLVKGEF